MLLLLDLHFISMVCMLSDVIAVANINNCLLSLESLSLYCTWIFCYSLRLSSLLFYSWTNDFGFPPTMSINVCISFYVAATSIMPSAYLRLSMLYNPNNIPDMQIICFIIVNIKGKLHRSTSSIKHTTCHLYVNDLGEEGRKKKNWTNYKMFL